MKISYTDDDTEDRNIFGWAFKKAFPLSSNGTSPQLDFSPNGDELLNYLNNSLLNKNKLPDLIFLDIKMLPKNGLDTLKEIKTNPLLLQIPVIIITDSKEEGDKIRAYKNGARAFLSKPMEFDRWVDIIINACSEVDSFAPVTTIHT